MNFFPARLTGFSIFNIKWRTLYCLLTRSLLTSCKELKYLFSTSGLTSMTNKLTCLYVIYMK